MFTLVICSFVAMLATGDEPGRTDARLLVDTIRSLQHPIEDFRCEFEGTSRARGKVAEALKVDPENVYREYTGIFIWKAAGDIRLESMLRQASVTTITSRTVVVRTQTHQAEEHIRRNDASIGSVVVAKPEDVVTWRSTYGTIFPIEKIKREVNEPQLEPTVSTEQVDGRPFKILSIRLAGVGGSTMFRYWIDLNRNGHVVRQEDYQSGQLKSRLEITLATFKVSGADVWMPVSGESVGYAALVDYKPVVMKEPQFFEKIYAVRGTMQFNNHPGPEVFTIKYKPGTPVSENLRKLQYEFGRQQLSPEPTKAEVQKMLDDQVAMAEKQKTELVVASPREDVDWTSWLAWAVGALVLIAFLSLWNQRRRR
jgi:hypothetical protein